MEKVKLANTNQEISVLGQGTYGIFKGESEKTYEKWREVLTRGIELGMTHLDTAELYGSGESERIVGQVVNSYNREDIFVTTKLLPSRTSEKDIRNAIEGSLNRLNLEYVDLYLLHWLESDTPLKLVMNLFEEFIEEGKTRFIGVSNFSISDYKKAQGYLKKHKLVTNQVKINLKNQEEILNLYDFYQKKNIILTAYSPIAKNDFSGLDPIIDKNLKEMMKKYNATKAQISLAWLIHHKNIIAIPRTSKLAHVEENALSSKIELTEGDIMKLSSKKQENH